MAYYLYLLHCADDTLYAGITTDLARRIREHNGSDLGARYTRGRRPVALAYSRRCKSRSEASRAEAALKKRTRAEKLRLIDKYAMRH